MIAHGGRVPHRHRRGCKPPIPALLLLALPTVTGGVGCGSATEPAGLLGDSDEATDDSSASEDDGSVDAPDSEEHPAVTQLRQTLLADDYEGLEAALVALDAARAEHSDDPDLEFFWAHANLWKLAEFDRDASQSQSEQLGAVQEALAAFERSVALRPDDHRVPCWLGTLEIGTGRLIADEDMVARGEANVAIAAAAFPEFGHFCEILAYWEQPIDSPEFARALEAGWRSADVCVDEPFDRSDPDAAPYLDEATATGPRRVCWNGELAPHNEEGYWLVMGDLFARAGEEDTARTMYLNAQLRDSYEDWRYRDRLEARLDTLPERVAAYRDDDPGNDPALSLPDAGCVMCHAR